jgi:hypothetical protein
MDGTELTNKTRELLADVRHFLKQQGGERTRRADKLAASLADFEAEQAVMERSIAARADQMDAALIRFLKNTEE